MLGLAPTLVILSRPSTQHLRSQTCPMILKDADDKFPALARVETLLKAGRIPPGKVEAVKQALRVAHAGIKGERECAYQLDFHARDSTRAAVIHDLRLELEDGRVAQIDHLVLHHSYRFYILETKHFTHGIKITEQGEFLRWNDWKKTFEGIPSPIEQNNRHALVVARAMRGLGLPDPVIRNFVLISDRARIDRPKHFDTSMVVKADQFLTAMQADLDAANPLGIIGGFLTSTLKGSVEEIGQKLVALHRPKEFDLLGSLGIVPLPPHLAKPEPIAEAPAAQAPTPQVQVPVPQPPPPEAASPAPTSARSEIACKACQGKDLTILHGRYGYYFCCNSCEANTKISLSCGQPGHNERLRKAGAQFFRECADCGTTLLFFENRER